MSSPEYEGFDMTEKDVLDAMNPLRRQKKRSKEDSIYGMWAESGSDDEASSRAGFGMSGGKNKKADYSRPVSFISGGFKGIEESKLEETEGLEESAHKIQQPKRTAKKQFSGTSGGIAEWERHTSGIGTRLLAQMGWKKGQGLGKNQQGIATPVEAKVRKGKGALGFYGSERIEPVSLSPDAKSVSKPKNQSVAASTKLGQWKKTPGEKKKVNYIVRSSADIASDGDFSSRSTKRGQQHDSSIASVKVIDLTGKEKVVYSGYSSLSRHHLVPNDEEQGVSMSDNLTLANKHSYFDVPELRHNLKLLVSSAEDDVIENLKVKDHENNQVACLAYDKQRLDTVIEEEEARIQQLQRVVALIKGFEGNTTTFEAVELLSRLETDFELEYKLYGLDRFMYPVVEPLLRKELTDWNPLSAAGMNRCFDSWTRLKGMFMRLEEPTETGMASQYDTLLWEIWLPHVRRAILNSWNPRDPECLITFFEKWQSLLPLWIWENICDQLLVPRILTEAENWNPITDRLPINSWIHPWLSLLGEKLEVIYLPIRQKLGTALANWHPSDPSARMLLLSWVRVWSEGHMRAFLLQHIGPKLAKVLQDFEINPRQQQIDPWKWVFDWVDMLPQPFFTNILEKFFFPKWLHVLASWLDNSADFQEVSRWYVGWKELIPTQLSNEPIVKDNLGKALAMMNQVLTGGSAETVLMAQIPSSSSALPQSIPRPSLPPNVTFSFKEIIERRAEASGLVFMPISRRDQTQQIYQLGRVTLYIDRNVVFVSSGGVWTPVSIDELFNMA